VRHARVQEHRQVRVERDAAEARHVVCVGGGQSLALDPPVHGRRGDRALFTGSESLGPQTPLGREDVRRREGGDHLGGGDRAEAARRHRLCELGRRRRLHGVVELVDEPGPPRVDEADHVRVDVVRLLVRRREEAQHEEVERHVVQHARPLHLDGDLLAARTQRAPVDLTDGGRRHRLGREGREDVLDPDRELSLDDLAAERRREGLDAVLQLLEALGVGRRKKVGADAQHLPNLDRSDSQPRDQLQQLLRTAVHHRLLAAELLVSEHLAHETCAEEGDLCGAPQRHERPGAEEAVGRLGVVLGLAVGSVQHGGARRR